MKNSSLGMGLLAMLLCSSVMQAAEIPATPITPTTSKLMARHRTATAEAPSGVSLLARVAKPVVANADDKETERVVITQDMPSGA
jgi:hypothetical protein